MGKLKNSRRELFCQEYLVDLNATRAAERAKYSKKTACSQGQRLLRNVEVQKRIQELKEKRKDRVRVDQDRVLGELARLGFSNIQNYIGSSTESYITFKDIEKVPEEAAKAIKSIKVNHKRGTIEFKLHDKEKALELLGKHLGIFVDRYDITQRGTVLVKVISKIPRSKKKKKKKNGDTNSQGS